MFGAAYRVLGLLRGLAGREAIGRLRRRWLLSAGVAKGSDQMGDQSLVRAGRGESDADARGGLDDACADLHQADLQGGELGALQRRRVRDGLLDGPQQPVGGGVQGQAQLVGGGAHARCPVALELGLVELDEVLGAPPIAIVELVEPFRRGAFQRRDDGADVEPEGGRLVLSRQSASG